MKRELLVVGRIPAKHAPMPVEHYLVLVTLFFVVVLMFSSFQKIGSPDLGGAEQLQGTSWVLERILSDGKISVSEEKYLASLDCDGLKEIFGTDKSVCMHLRDAEGNIIPFDGKAMSVGCPGFFIDGASCGNGL